MPIHVRPATRNDVPRIHAIAREALPDKDDALDLDGYFDMPARIHNLHTLIVAEDIGTIAGYAFYMPFLNMEQGQVDLDTAVLQHICVSRTHQRQDIATVLETEGLKVIRAKRYRRVVARATDDGAAFLSTRDWTVQPRGQQLRWMSQPHAPNLTTRYPSQLMTFADSDRQMAIRKVS